jgi:hypothetical protein
MAASAVMAASVAVRPLAHHIAMVPMLAVIADLSASTVVVVSDMVMYGRYVYLRASSHLHA